ncbi:MAG: hypothetical protein RDU30_03650 [Desulfovibrionaceae bacterium]|nr:hypothetical protein [Desulfovibrionaceae bacterium]
MRVLWPDVGVFAAWLFVGVAPPRDPASGDVPGATVYEISFVLDRDGDISAIRFPAGNPLPHHLSDPSESIPKKV